MNKLWEIYPHLWKSESELMNWIRGGIRRASVKSMQELPNFGEGLIGAYRKYS